MSNHINTSSETENLAENLLKYWQIKHPGTKKELLETHISWIILLNDYAYKLKKPVNFGFLDFSTLEKRKFYCEEEIRLNKRTAPEIYLDVISVSGSSSSPVPGDDSTPIDYLVKMKRFASGSLLLDKIRQRQLTKEMVSNLARTISDFHSNVADQDIAHSLEYGSPEQIMVPVRDNIAQIKEIIRDVEFNLALDKLMSWSEEQHKKITPLLLQRKKEGYVRECHGDLHLGNIFYQDKQCVLFDCIEFSPNLRWIDTANDIAFTIMDMESHDRPDFSRQLLNEYLELTGDYDALFLMPFYLVYRALVRSKVSALRSSQPHADNKKSLEKCYDYIQMAENYTKTAGSSLSIMCGLSGTGKTTVARKLVSDTGAIQLRSDIERKRIFQLRPDENSREAGLNIYTENAKQKTFAELKRLTQNIINAGYPVIVDATFLNRNLRDIFQSIAKDAKVPFFIFHTTSSSREAKERLAQRKSDASEAEYQQYQNQKKIFEEFSEDEMPSVVTIDTSDNSDEKGLHKAALCIRQSKIQL